MFGKDSIEIGSLSLNGTYLLNTSEENLAVLAEIQTKFGKILSKIVDSPLSMYTLREDPNTKDITVRFVIDA